MNFEQESIGSNVPISSTFSTLNHSSNNGVMPQNHHDSLSGAGTASGKCFKCQKEGHFARECPQKLNRHSPSKPEVGPSSPTPNSDSNIPAIQCSCGAGICLIRTSKTGKNPNRKFYTCPAKFEKKCQYFHWCDTLNIDDINQNCSPQPEYPICACGAGKCSLFTEKYGCNVGRKYFACPLPKGYGACNFLRWQDEFLGSSNVNVSESRFVSSPQGIPHSRHHTSNADNYPNSKSHTNILCEDRTPEKGNPFLTYPNKEFMKPQLEFCRQLSFAEATSTELTDNHVVDETGETDKSFPTSPYKELMKPRSEFCRQLSFAEATSPGQANNHLANGTVKNNESFPTHPYEELMKKPRSKFCWQPACALASSSENNNNDLGDGTDGNDNALPIASAKDLVKAPGELWRHLTCAQATSSGIRHIFGWWGRLAFAPPRCLTAPPPRPFYCCVFPSFDLITATQCKDVVNSRDLKALSQSHMTVESEGQPLLTASWDHQSPDEVLREPLGVKSPSTMVEGSIMTESIFKVFGQAAISVQNELISLLLSMDPPNHVAMTREANSAFAALNCLRIDYRCFHGRVKEFIACVAVLAEIEDSPEKIHFSYRELGDRFEYMKVRFDDATCVHAAATVSVTGLKKSLGLISEEVGQLRNMLVQFENQLSIFEAKTVDMEAKLLRASQQLVEPGRMLQALAQEAAETLRKHKQWEAERAAAAVALEKARLQLVN